MDTGATASSSSPLLTLRAVSHTVKDGDRSLPILHAINLTVFPGEHAAIIGRSGSGKTTLLHTMSGLIRPTQGEVFFKSTPLHQYNDDKRAQLRACHMGFVFQHFQLIDTLTVLENVMLPLEINRCPSPHTLAYDALCGVELADKAHRYPRQLSGGEQQRVAIARAYAPKPSLLFADEPTGNLDTQTAQHVMQWLFALHQQHGTTLIVVTHDTTLAQQFRTRWQLHNGCIRT